VLAISIGDPGGIGPEVLVRSLADPARRGAAVYRIYGSSVAMLDAARSVGIEPFWVRVPHDACEHLVGPMTGSTHPVVLVDHDGPDGLRRPVHERRATAAGGELSFQWVEAAIRDARRARAHPLYADAIVTAPISKEAWALAGHGAFPGHTELLAARFGSDRSAMMFESPTLRVVLVTAHVPLMEVGRAITTARVLETIKLGTAACVRLGVATPRIAVCGLNPHAGEAGLLGREDDEVIAPAIASARAEGLSVRGPFPGDTIFNRAVRGEFDLVVAMYHDQGLIPVKLLAFDRAVNVTLGLPTVRTSPDHGTAYDIAGQNRADPGSMSAALDLAIRLVDRVPGNERGR
jgi:4-hydroxythreonine-4-phosphate dehydrogenase